MITFLKTFLGISLIMGFWVLIQRAWMKGFASLEGESDALACRGGCGRCTGACEENTAETGSAQEAHHAKV